MNNYVLIPLLVGVFGIVSGFLPPKDGKSIICWVLGGINIIVGTINYFIMK